MATITRQKDGVFYRAEAYGFSTELMDYVRTFRSCRIVARCTDALWWKAGPFTFPTCWLIRNTRLLTGRVGRLPHCARRTDAARRYPHRRSGV